MKALADVRDVSVRSLGLCSELLIYQRFSDSVAPEGAATDFSPIKKTANPSQLIPRIFGGLSEYEVFRRL